MNSDKKLTAKEFVKKWMQSYEYDTFIKSDIENQGYWYTSKCGHSSLNIECFFEDLLEDYINESQQQTAELEVKFEKYNRLLIETLDDYNNLKLAADKMAKALEYAIGGYLNPEKKIKEALANYNSINKQKLLS